MDLQPWGQPGMDLGVIRPTVYSGADYLDAYGQGTTPGTSVDIWPCTGGANQEWTLNSNGTITGNRSGLCLDEQHRTVP